MAQHDDRDRFIPFRKAEVVDLLCHEGTLDAEHQTRFRAFCKVLESLCHFEYHGQLEKMKEHYFPFNPDRDTKTKRTYDASSLTAHEDALMAELADVLDGANYEKLTEAELQHALEEESLFRISLFVDFNDFSRVVLFRRGDVVKKAEIVKWFFRKETIDVPTFERVALLVRFKDKAYFEARSKRQQKKKAELPFEPGTMVLKLFKDVPKADLEMLFPNTEVRMRPRDWALLLGPGVIGGFGVLLKSAASLAVAATLIWALMKAKLESGENLVETSLSPEQGAVIVAALMALVGIGGFMVKQWLKFKNRKILFMKTLADNLYFKNLDNNEGVLNHIIDGAEEEECKEAMLAYYFLLKHPEGLTEAQLDDAIEHWFEAKHETRIDFEVDDGLRKLNDLGLTEECGQSADGATIYRVPGLDEGCRRLDEIWDNLFSYNNDAAGADAN
jgi:hypothetical protein